MIERVINALKANSNVSDYRIIKTDSCSYEVFYILDKVETIRSTKLDNSLQLTVYVDKDGKRGQATVSIMDSYSDVEIATKIKDACYAASFTLNTYFELCPGEKKEFANQSNIVKHFSSDTALEIAQACFKASTFDNGWISSMEVFIKESRVQILNSKGVDYTYFTNGIEIEVIPTFKNDKEEIELYNCFTYDQLDFDKITDDTYEFLKNAKLRSDACKYTGPNTIPVILKSEEIKSILKSLVDNFDYANVYNKMNLVNIDDKFYGEGNDMPDISLVPYVKGSISNREVDSDGIILKDTKVVENNRVVMNHGDNRYAYYLGVDKATGVFPNIKVEQGKYQENELLKEQHLLCLSFSSFQFDIFSGNFGGEVRLALYFDGNTYTPVTGITIGGNIHELKSHLSFSDTIERIKGYEGPKYCKVDTMSVN